MTKREWKTLPITERALVQRLNRALAKNDQVLRKSRTESEYGTYFTIKARINSVVEDRADIEAMGRALGTLKRLEALITIGAGR